MSIKEINKSGKTLFQVYVYQVSKKLNKRIQKRRYTKSKQEAVKLEKQLLLEASREICKMEGEGIMLGELLDKWYGYHSFSRFSNLGKETREDYYNALSKWYAHLLKQPVSQIKRSDIKEVIQMAEANSKSRSFQAKLKNMINIVFKWGLDEGVIRDILDSPAKGIQLKRNEEKKPEILNMKQSALLLQRAKEYDHPWYPIWAFALLSGCRNGEIYALDWNDIDFETNKITISKSYNTRRKEIKSTKAGYYRNIPINDDLRSLLLELRNTNPKTHSFVLPRLPGWHRGNQAEVLRAFLESINLPSVKFHTLRACFATMLLHKNVPPITVMKVCGWRDLDTMARYIRLAGIDEEGATDSLQILPTDVKTKLLELPKNS